MDDKKQKLAIAREKWQQKKKELQAQKEKELQAQKEKELQAQKEKELQAQAQESVQESKEGVDYEDKISTLMSEINELKKTKARKLKKIEYYGSDDEKPPPEPQTPVVVRPKVKQIEEQPKPKVEVKNFFGRFI